MQCTYIFRMHNSWRSLVYVVAKNNLKTFKPELALAREILLTNKAHNATFQWRDASAPIIISNSTTNSKNQISKTRKSSSTPCTHDLAHSPDVFSSPYCRKLFSHGRNGIRVFGTTHTQKMMI